MAAKPRHSFLVAAKYECLTIHILQLVSDYYSSRSQNVIIANSLINFIQHPCPHICIFLYDVATG